MEAPIDLGWTVRDRVTGFQGVAMGYVQYLSGCNQVLVVPRVDKDGKIQPGEWLDEQRLERVGDEQIVLRNLNPGFDAPPPRRI